MARVWVQLARCYAVLALATGCGQTTDQPEPVGPLANEQGTVSMGFGAEARVPSDYPTDILLYPGLKVTLAYREAAHAQIAILGTTADPVEEVASHFDTSMQANGWERVKAIDEPIQEKLRMRHYVKGNRESDVVIQPRQNETTVTLTTLTRKGG